MVDAVVVHGRCQVLNANSLVLLYGRYQMLVHGRCQVVLNATPWISAVLWLRVLCVAGPEEVSMLLQHYASIDLKTTEGLTPIELLMQQLSVPDSVGASTIFDNTEAKCKALVQHRLSMSRIPRLISLGRGKTIGERLTNTLKMLPGETTRSCASESDWERERKQERELAIVSSIVDKGLGVR